MAPMLVEQLRSQVVSTLGDRRLMVRAGAALVLANARYWTTVAPLVHGQLRRWERSAQRIRDPTLQSLALATLREEGFNAEVAATLATLTPRAHRAHAVEAIIALEVLYDYLDGLTETPSHDALRDGRQLLTAFTDALTPSDEGSRDYYRYHPQSNDDGYLEELVATVRNALAALPAADAVAAVAQRAAMRCAEAEVRAHAVPRTGTTQLEEWAKREAANTALEWREYLAGSASSVLAVHALIAAAADQRTTPEQATAIDTVYISIAVLSTMLDSLIDYEHDLDTGEPGYIRYYEDPDVLARRLTSVTRHAAIEARTLPKGPHHVMTLAGVVAYYTSAPAAASNHVRPVATHLQRELKPLITPTLTVMRTWRLAKRLRRQRHGRSPTRDGELP
jgi:tetraprenyl-beta-curcumene synthase